MKFFRILAVISLMFGLTGCSPFETFSDMSQKKSEFNKLSADILGVDAEIGWNINNGELTNLNVIYPNNSLGSISVNELKIKVVDMVEKVYGTGSYSLSISIVVETDGI